ncbi:MAG: hypothetical protein IIY52_09700 [Solobacterium sp.]|nr:hypothetical protein [Solobacterium sp.]
MKKTTKYLIAALCALIVIVLVAVNRKNASKDDERVSAGELVFETVAGEAVYSYKEGGDDYVTFDTEMRRKNGDVFAKTYSGRELSAILAEMDYTVTENSEITAVCADSYEIVLTGAEILDPGNVYIVNREGEEALEEESGPFMLVVNHDEFATRWGKNIVRIKVSE